MGGALTLAGLGGLGYIHLLEYVQFWDAVCVSLVASGSMSLAASIKHEAETKKQLEKSEQKFEFKLLNDSYLHYKEVKNLEGVLDLNVIYPKELTDRLTVARGKQVKECFDQREERTTQLTERMKTSLDAGATFKEAMEELHPRVFVLDFVDNIGRRKPTQSTRDVVHRFADMVSLVISVANKHDEVVVRVTSPGGAVMDYGLAASQMARLKRAGLSTVACVDTVAASGGYMLACVADKLVAAPFAFLGSIGVVAQMFNFHKVLKRVEVDPLLFTAGKYKRTVTPFQETTPDAVEKFNKDIAEIHDAFKEHVSDHRATLERTIDDVATGETWLALQAKQHGLVDELMTSDEYLRGRMDRFDVLLVQPVKRKKSLADLLEKTASESAAAMSQLLSGSWIGGLFGRGAAEGAVQARSAVPLESIEAVDRDHFGRSGHL